MKSANLDFRLDFSNCQPHDTIIHQFALLDRCGIENLTVDVCLFSIRFLASR